MSSRLVITPWDGKDRELLDRCIESVAKSGVEHRVVECGPEWLYVMFEMRNDADAIAWVDADDIVYSGALTLAFDTIEQNNVGLVYTDECRIDINDKQLNISTSGEKKLWDLVSHPGCVHHLTVTKKNSITERALEAHKITNTALDWAMRVDAGVSMGMKHVPILGYGWRYRPGQITSTAKNQEILRNSIQPSREIFREWLTGLKQQ